MPARPTPRASPAIALCLVALAALACSFRQVPKNPLATEFTVEKEVEIGAQIHRQIRDQLGLVSDPILLDYLNELGQELVEVTEPQPFVYRFNLIESDDLNAFAVPGGYIYIHTEVLAQAGDVTELQGVLAHEVAHIRKRHIARAQEKSGVTSLTTLAAIAAAIASGDSDVAMAATTVAQGINVGLQLKHSREHEAEADREGIGYMLEIGAAPSGMVHFFQRILADQRDRAGQIPPYLYSHPAIRERIESAKVEIARRSGTQAWNAPAPLTLDPESPRPATQTHAQADERLRAMQQRLAVVLEPVAGGSGLQARARFDPALTDDLLAEAHQAAQRGELAEADALLLRAETIEPSDPRVRLARAEVAEQRDDLDLAMAELTRAFELDPYVPLVQYELGVIHKRLGNRTRAVFYLEQAATNFKPGSSARKRAEFEISTLAWPVLDASGVAHEEGGGGPERFAAGERVVWWGQVNRRFAGVVTSFEVRWLDPQGRVAHTSPALMSSRGKVSAVLDSAGAEPGYWTVEVHAGDSRIEQRGFEITPPEAG